MFIHIKLKYCSKLYLQLAESDDIVSNLVFMILQLLVKKAKKNVNKPLVK